MMGAVLVFPRQARDFHGCVHVMPGEGGGFEIGHESSSGNSWGSFDTFATAEAAVAGAYALNREQYEGRAEVVIWAPVRAALAVGPDPKGGF
jgi:hypothetical protein